MVEYIFGRVPLILCFIKNVNRFYSILFYLFVGIFCNKKGRKTSENPSTNVPRQMIFQFIHYYICCTLFKWLKWTHRRNIKIYTTKNIYNKKYINDIQKHKGAKKKKKIGEKWNLWILKWMDYFVRRFVCWFGCMSQNIFLSIFMNVQYTCSEKHYKYICRIEKTSGNLCDFTYWLNLNKWG